MDAKELKKYIEKFSKFLTFLHEDTELATSRKVLLIAELTRTLTHLQEKLHALTS